jgi:hypothetical protein
MPLLLLLPPPCLQDFYSKECWAHHPKSCADFMAFTAVLSLLLLLPCLQDFYSKECWAHHPKPYADFMAFKQKERAELEAERKKAVRV